jgi:hypothetical protein
MSYGKKQFEKKKTKFKIFCFLKMGKLGTQVHLKKNRFMLLHTTNIWEKHENYFKKILRSNFCLGNRTGYTFCAGNTFRPL